MHNGNEPEFDTLNPETRKAVNALALANKTSALRYFLEVKPDFPFDTLEKEKDALFLQRFPVTINPAEDTRVEMRVVYRILEKNPSYPGDPAANRLIAIGDAGDRNRVRERFKEFVIGAFSFLHVDEKDDRQSAPSQPSQPEDCCSKRRGPLPNIARMQDKS